MTRVTLLRRASSPTDSPRGIEQISLKLLSNPRENISRHSQQSTCSGTIHKILAVSFFLSTERSPASRRKTYPSAQGRRDSASRSPPPIGAHVYSRRTPLSDYWPCFPGPRVCYSVSFNNRRAATAARATAICISLRPPSHRELLSSVYFGGGTFTFAARRPGNYYSRHRGTRKFSASLCFTRVNGAAGRGRRKHGDGETDETATRREKVSPREVSLQFNFYAAPCHFYPGSSRRAECNPSVRFRLEPPLLIRVARIRRVCAADDG